MRTLLYSEKTSQTNLQHLVDNFLEMMRERGRGSVALAWRRYFDSDGDGSLSFAEFCSALAEFNYRKDVLSLWADISHGVTLFAVVTMYGLFLIGLTYRATTKRFRVTWDTGAIAAVYATAVVLSYLLRG